MIPRKQVDTSAFNPAAELPFELRLKDFELAMQDIYDFFHDVNTALMDKGLPRLVTNGCVCLFTRSMVKASLRSTESR